MAGAEKKASRERRTLIFIDESGFYLLPGLVRTYGPKGETPILEEWHSKDHLSVMSGITPRGHLFTRVRKTAVHSPDCVTFLKHVERQLGSKVLAIWDRSPIHRGREVKAYLAQDGRRRIHLELLPGYAPELNPDEGVWQHLKHVELRNVCALDLEELTYHLHNAIVRMRRQPLLIQSFFAGAKLDIAKL